MAVRVMKAAIVGCGKISYAYLQTLKRFKALQVTACVDINPKRAAEQAETFGIKAMTMEQAMEDPEIQMIINLTIPAAHYEVTKCALENGKHVFSEKTLTITLDEGKELCRLAEEKNLRLGVAPDTFLGGGIQTARYILEHGLIGEPVSFVASLCRNYGIFGDIFPHLHDEGDGVLFDMGGYYLYALMELLGPADKVSAFAGTHNPKRCVERVDRENFGEPFEMKAKNLITASMKMENGITGVFHLNGDAILDEKSQIEIYGTKGTLILGDPNMFGGSVYLKKTGAEKVQFPFTHGFLTESRGIGATEMAWSIAKGRPHRASMERAYHALDIMYGFLRSSEIESVCRINSTFPKSAPLAEGWLDNGFWGPTEETVFSL